jgi:hypothetical protein
VDEEDAAAGRKLLSDIQAADEGAGVFVDKV